MIIYEVYSHIFYAFFSFKIFLSCQETGFKLSTLYSLHPRSCKPRNEVDLVLGKPRQASRTRFGTGGLNNQLPQSMRTSEEKRYKTEDKCCDALIFKDWLNMSEGMVRSSEDRTETDLKSVSVCIVN